MQIGTLRAIIKICMYGNILLIQPLFLDSETKLSLSAGQPLERNTTSSCKPVRTVDEEQDEWQQDGQTFAQGLRQQVRTLHSDEHKESLYKVKYKMMERDYPFTSNEAMMYSY